MALTISSCCCRIAAFSIAASLSIPGFSQDRSFKLPDSVKAVSLIADVSIRSYEGKKDARAGIGTNTVSLFFEAEKNEKEIIFKFPGQAGIVARGVGVESEDDELEWEYDWALNTNYRLLIASAADSAGNFVLYSGYVFLPGENKWKLLGSCRLEGRRDGILSPAVIHEAEKNSRIDAEIRNLWVQRAAGGWKPLDAVGTSPVPSIVPMPAVDSVRQLEIDNVIIRRAIAEGRTDVAADTLGIFYKITDPGNGKAIDLRDTVTVKYQLRIFGSTEIIDQATDQPASFPLNRLIKAWQIAIPMVRTGGKLKIVIPSAYAYSIRTRAPKIPPNSILEFEIEVLDSRR
ncbi:MAG TPA: FKBP-type peptidyl-prolyl cis-trans isomerase [Chitinophagaceae bacterium]